MSLYQVIKIDKNSDIIENIKKFYNMCITPDFNFTTLMIDDKEEIWEDNCMGRFNFLDQKTKINGFQDYSLEKINLMKKIVTYSKNLINNTNWNVIFADEHCIEPHLVTAPSIHPVAFEEHTDSDEYGKCCTVLYYFDIDEKIIGGELFIKESNENINVNIENDEVKIVCLNSNVIHRVNKIEGEGNRKVLCIFLGIN